MNLSKQYCLINKITNEKHICSKIVIDGFDYYVNDDIAKQNDKLYLLRDSLLGKIGDIITIISTRSSHTEIFKANGDKHWFASNTEYQREWNWKKILATTNPNIDIPKVIDEVVEVEEIANIYFPTKGKIENYKVLDENVPKKYWFYRGI